MMFGKNTSKKREYIARIAGDVFFAKGYKESSLQDVSAKSKISKAGIYHYFKSKSEILSFILIGYAEHGIAALHQCLEENRLKMTPTEILASLCETYAGYLLKNRKTSLLVLRDRHQLTGKHRNELLKREREIFHLFREQLRHVPDLNRKYDLSLISFQIISMIHWMGYWFDAMGPLSEREAVKQVIAIVFNGILTKKS